MFTQVRGSRVDSLAKDIFKAPTCPTSNCKNQGKLCKKCKGLNKYEFQEKEISGMKTFIIRKDHRTGRIAPGEELRIPAKSLEDARQKALDEFGIVVIEEKK